MQCMTVEPFTARVLVTDVDHVSSLLADPRTADTVSSGEGDSVGSHWQEKPPCKGQILNDGRSFAARQLLSKIQKKLMQLTAEIIRLLNEKEQRLLAKRKHDDLNGSEPTGGAA
jgi:hypothetical protein